MVEGDTAAGVKSAVVREDGKVELWNWGSRLCEQTVRLDGIAPRRQSLRVSACSHGARLLIGCVEDFDKEAKVWCLQSGHLKQVLAGHGLAVTAVALSPDGSSAATGSEDATLKIWSAWGGHLKMTLEGHRKLVTCVVFFPSGSALASGALDCTVRCWCLETGVCTVTCETPVFPGRPEVVHSWEIQPEAVLGIDISPDGASLASCHECGVVAVWCTTSGECRTNWEAHQSGVGHVAFSPAGTLLATSSCRDGVGSAKIWNLVDGSCQRELKLVALRSLSFWSATLLVTIQCFPDWAVRLWNVDTGRELGERRLHDTAVAQIAPWQ